MYSDPSAGVTSLVLSLVVVAIVLLVLYFIIRNAVTDGMKNYQQWRETTGRDVPPAGPTTPTAGR